MSEFKRSLAITSVSAVIAIGGFIGAQELSADYDSAKQDCIERFDGAKDVESCQENIGRDESGALETFAYLGMIGTFIGGWAALDARD